MNKEYGLENLDLEEQNSYRSAIASIKKTKKNEPTAIGQIGNAIANGADFFIGKVSDVVGMIETAIPVADAFLSGDDTYLKEFLKEQDKGLVAEIKNNSINKIKKRREELNRYVENNLISGTILKVGTGFIEQSIDPLQMGANIATQGFYMNALQNTLDYIYEENLLNNRNIKDFNSEDIVSIGTGIAMAGVTSKFEVKGVTKPLYQETKFVPPLDTIVKENSEYGERTFNRGAIADVIKRQDTGQTLSMPRGYNASDTIEKTIDDGVITRLKTILDTLQKENNNTKYLNTDFKDGDIKVKSEVIRIIKPVYTEISLGRKQALGEIAEELGNWGIKNNKYDGITPVGDYIDTIIKDIEPDELVRLYQNKSKDPAYKDLQPILHKYINEFVGIKAKKDLSYKENGFYINTLYNKQHLMTMIRNSYEDENNTYNFIKGQLKEIGEKVYLDEKQAKDVGLEKAGFYSFKENPKEMLKALYYDINATTKAVEKSNSKGDIGLTEKTIFDVALNWTNMADKEKYIELISKKELVENEKIFVEKFQKQMLGKFESIFKGFEQDKREVLENIISTIANERSGYNKAMEKFDNFTTAYKYNDGATKPMQWLGFEMQPNMSKKLIEEIDGLKSLSAYNVVKAKNYNELSLNDKSIKIMKDSAAWKLLTGLRHLREASPNTAIVNTGAYRLGFDDRIGFLKGNFEMYKAHYDLLKNYDTLISRDLSSISDPIEKMEVELFVRKLTENGYNFDKIGLGKTLDKLAKIGGAGQSVSDVHRVGMALRFTSKAMYDEFPNMKYNDMTPEMRTILKNNGIDEIALKDIQEGISQFKSYDDFLNFVMNTDLEKGGKIKSLFEQFTDVMGREFEPYDKNLTKISSDKALTKLWVNSTMLFKRYSMGAFSRAFETATSYYDSNDILRYRFIKNGVFNTDNAFNGFWKGAKHHSINLSKMSAGLFISTQAVKWAHGKMFGTADDEMVEAKYEAFIDGDYLPIIAEGLKDSLTDYIGYDVMFGGTPAFFGTLKQTGNALTRGFTSDLEPEQKVLYSLLHIISPMNISRGIDNIKFGKNISTNLNSWSADANYLWKRYYRHDALDEQADGELPIETAIKKSFEKITDWDKYFDKNIDKAFEVTNFPEDTDEKIVKMAASGVMELTERSMREDHIMYSFSIDDKEERENNLKEFGLDYKTQLMKLDPKIRDLFNYVMSFKEVKEPMYLIMALEEITNSRDKIETLYNFLDENEITDFDVFAKNIMKQEEKKKEIARRGYEDSTDGYIEFLQTLRNEM